MVRGVKFPLLRVCLFGLSGILGSVLLVMAQTPYESARSNLASYVEAAGLDRLADAIPMNAHQWAPLLGVALIVLSVPAIVVIVIRWFYRRRKNVPFAFNFRSRVTEQLVKSGWILDFNPKSARGRKPISFNAEGTIGEGRNKNEFRWVMRGHKLEIFRENGDLQNRFQYDELADRFICTNDVDAKGIKDQVIYRVSTNSR